MQDSIQQRIMLITNRINQLDVERSQLVQDLLKLSGQSELIQQLAKEDNGENVIKFPEREQSAPEGEGEPKGND